MGIRKEREMKQDASDMARESFNREETEGVETWIVISSENLQDHNHPVIRQKSAITNGLFHFQCISHKLFHHCANQARPLVHRKCVEQSSSCMRAVVFN